MGSIERILVVFIRMLHLESHEELLESRYRFDFFGLRCFRNSRIETTDETRILEESEKEYIVAHFCSENFSFSVSKIWMEFFILEIFSTFQSHYYFWYIFHQNISTWIPGNMPIFRSISLDLFESSEYRCTSHLRIIKYFEWLKLRIWCCSLRELHSEIGLILHFQLLIWGNSMWHI